MAPRKLPIPKTPTLQPTKTTVVAYGNNTGCMVDSHGLIYEGNCKRLEIKKNKVLKNAKKESTKG